VSAVDSAPTGAASHGGVRAWLGRHRAIVTSYAIALVLFVAGTLHSLDFAAPSQLKTMLIYASFIGIIGLGQTLCILTGGIDLSVPWTLTGAAVLTSVLTSKGHPLGGTIVLVLVLAAVVGTINGLGVAYAGVPPIIMTLGMNGALQGLLLVYTNGGISANPPRQLTEFVLGNMLGLPTQLWIWAVVIVLGCALLSLTTFGRRLYAIGTNRRAAELAGIRVRRTLVVPYVLSALGAAVTGLLLMGFTGQAFLSMGDPYLFSSAVAVAVGGASILGGSGHYAGTIGGALVLTLVASLLPLFSLGTAWLQIAYGLILLATVYAASLHLTRKKRSNTDA
jgi:ribose transport system permease protein